MKRNLGKTDRMIRAGVGVLAGALYIFGAVRGTTGLVLGIVGLAMLATSIMGFCSLYVPFGIDTRERSGRSCGQDSD